MANPMEGLAYVINTDGPDPRAMFEAFITFCEQGSGDGPGVFDTEDGVEVRGLVDWLVHLPVSEVNFFATEPSAAGTMFVASLSENGVPWIHIPRFMDFVTVGPLPQFADENGQIKLASVVRLDDEFRRRVAARHEALGLLPTESAERLSGALSKSSSVRNEALSALEEPLQGQVRALLDL